MEDFSNYSKQALEISCRALTDQVARLEQEVRINKEIIRYIEIFSDKGSRLVKLARSLVKQ